MLDLIFLILMIVIIFKANKGEVNETMCGVALVIGILAGILGLVQAFFLNNGPIWILNLAVMLIAFFLKRIAKHFAGLYNEKMDEITRIGEKYRKTQERYPQDDEKPVYTDDNFDDPNIRFGGGNGEVRNGK